MRTSLNLTITETGLSLAIEHADATEAQLTTITAITGQTLNTHIDELAAAMKVLASERTEPVASEPAESAAEVEARLREHIELQTTVIVDRNERIASLRETVAAKDERIAELSKPQPAGEPPSADAAPIKEAIELQEAAIEKIEAQQKRITSLLDTIRNQDILIAELRRKPAAPPAIGGLPVVEPEPAVSNGKAQGTRKPAPPLARTGYDEFHALVPAEMKRLAPLPNTIPSHKLWDDQRNPKLPTMQGVVRRYGCQTIAELAAKLGMEPPLGRGQTTDAASEVAA